MFKKKVLILYVSAGMGHKAAAQALQKAFLEQGNTEVISQDILDFANASYRRVFIDGYDWVSSRLPGLWGLLYKGFDHKKSQRLPELISLLVLNKKLTNFLTSVKADHIIATHPLASVLITNSSNSKLKKISSSLVVTDFGCHSFWVNKDVNYYFVATDDVAKSLQDYQIKPSQIIVSGIPIREVFQKTITKAQARSDLKINGNKFTFLIVGGQFEYKELFEIIERLENIHNGKLQYLVVAGRDKRLEQKLKSSELKSKSNIHIKGFIENIDILMSATDVIFTKAGGLTVSECLAKGLPMVFNNVIPGQEEDNANYLVKKGAAVRAKTPQAVAEIVGEFVKNPAALKPMQLAAQKLAKPIAAKEIVNFVLKNS